MDVNNDYSEHPYNHHIYTPGNELIQSLVKSVG